MSNGKTPHISKAESSEVPKLNDGEVSARQLLQNTELEQLVHYVGSLPSRYVNPASWIDFTDATLVPVQRAPRFLEKSCSDGIAGRVGDVAAGSAIALWVFGYDVCRVHP